MTNREKAKELCGIVFEQPTAEISVLKRLPQGRSNALFLMSCNNVKVTVRIPGKASDIFIDRKLEEAVLSIAEGINITPKTYFFDETSGVKISDYVGGGTLSKGPTDNELKMLSQTLHKLHNCSFKKVNAYDPFTYIESLMTHIKPMTFSEGWGVKQLDALKTAYKAPMHSTLIHGDVNPTNCVIDEHSHLWLLDFEYAKRYDPLYDIACMGSASIESALTLLEIYLDRKPSSKEVAIIYYYRALQTFTWYLIALIKHQKNVGLEFTIDFEDIAISLRKETEKLWQEYRKITKG